MYAHIQKYRASFKSIVAKKLLFQSLGESFLSVKWQNSEKKQTGKFKRNSLLYVSLEHKLF